jgi:peptidyl-prolyl cis-trans isomerase C
MKKSLPHCFDLPVRATVTAVFLLACAAPTWAQTAAAAAPVVAPAAPVSLVVTVNGELQEAERGELLLREFMGRGAADSPQLRAAVRETLINQAVMSQDAIKQELNKLPLVKARLALTEQNALAQAWQQKAIQDAQISDADIKAEYDSQVKAMGSQEYRVRHVLLADETKAKQILAKIKVGAKFETMAGESSLDKVTAAQGGLSEWMPEGRLMPEVFAAIKGLKNGQLVPQPVKTASGWQVLRLEEKRPSQPLSLDAAKPQIRLALAQRQVQVRLNALKAAAKIN